MTAFYQRSFGLTVVDEIPGDYCVLESEAWSLALVQISEMLAAKIRLSVPPARREGAPIKLAFEVSSIEQSRSTIVGLGGEVDRASTQWVFRGFVHCDGVDPEGNVVQLKERVDRVLQ